MPAPSSNHSPRFGPVGLLVVAVVFALLPALAQVRISEVLPEDRWVLPDEDGDHSGWIELHNAGTNAEPLGGYGLSDDPARPFRWTFPDITLAPDGRLVVFTSGKDRKLSAGPLTNAAAELRPDQVGGLRWWVDAADTNSLVLADGAVAEWRDKSGRKPADDYPAPQSPGAIPGKVLWLDAAQSATVETTGPTVLRWRDQSGAGKDFQQPEAAQRPVLRSDAEGLPQLSFDGDDDLLVAGADVTIQTLVWVGDETAAAGSLAPLAGHSTRYDFHRGDRGGLLGAYSGMPAGIVNAAVYLNGQRVHPQDTVLPAGRNVVVIVGSASGTINNLASDRLLPGRSWHGSVNEVIGFNRSLSETEVLALDRHLRAKWHGPADQLAADFHARQDRASWRPRPVQDPLTGLPAVRFDGLDGRLGFAEVKQARSLFLVVHESEAATDAFRPFLGHSSSAFLSRGSDGLLLYSPGPETWLEGESVNPTVTRPPQRRTTLTFRRGNYPVDSLAMDRGMDDRLFEGDVMEIALFDREVSEAERLALEAYLARKWLLPDRRLHTSFGLKQAGDPVLLTAPGGQRLDATIPVQTQPDQSYGRIGDGPTWGWFARPTPGRPNLSRGVELGLAPDPVIEPAGAFFADTQSVRLTAPSNSSPDVRIYFTTNGSEPLPGLAAPWLDDALPAGATSQNIADRDWAWVRTNPVPASGSMALRSGTVSGVHQFLVYFPASPVRVGEGGQLTAEVWLDPAAPPRELMLQFRVGESWNHRAFWGEDLVAAGTAGTASRRRAGELPIPGRWTRLEVALSALELADTEITGFALTLFNGRAAFDAVGYSPGPLPAIYPGPLSLSNSTVIRARAVAPGQLASPVVTASFLQAPPGNLPVVSLATAPDNLFADATGIYAAGPDKDPDGLDRLRNYQRNWERPVHAELFEPDGHRGFAVDSGLKIHGGFTRHWPQKSLRLHFRRRYGESVLRYRVFPDYALEQFESLVLRNSGNDWHRAYLRDDLAHSLAADIGLEHQASRPSHLFINGRYWGVQFLREQVSADTVARQHGLSDDDLDLVKNEGEVVAGDLQDYFDLLGRAQSAVTNPGRQPELAARINVVNQQDWLALELFAGNDDWPGNNVLAWRSRLPGGTWNWMLQDCDGGFDPQQMETDWIELVLGRAEFAALKGRSQLIMQGLLAGADYRRQFAVRLNDLLNTAFSTPHTVARLDAWEAALAGAMPAQILRWKDETSVTPPLTNITEWQTRVAEVRQFLQGRPGAFREHVRTFFSLGPDAPLTFRVEPAGLVEEVALGTLSLSAEELPWTAPYFAGLPVEIRVVPRWGYKVVAWSDGAPAGNSRVLTPETALTLSATLGVDPDATVVPFPAPHPLAAGDYRLEAWPAAALAGTYPPSMVFETSATQDPTLGAAITGYWTNRYDLIARSRVIGGGDRGLSFVNTGNPQDSAGYVAGALLALDTRGMREVKVSWVGGTELANARNYGLRLQWRAGTNAPFADVTDGLGAPVEYRRSAVDGDSLSLGPTQLPPAADDQPIIQLRWRYHSIPQPGESGARAQLRLDDIRVTASPALATAVLSVVPGAGPTRLAVQTAAGATCSLWVSADLRTWTELATASADPAGRAEFTDATGAAQRFYQVRVR